MDLRDEVIEWKKLLLREFELCQMLYSDQIKEHEMAGNTQKRERKKGEVA